MSNSFIPVNKPLIEKTDIDAVVACLQQGWISGDGPIIENFERIIAEKCNREFGIAVCNGTVAIDLAIEVLEIKKGDEVILPSFTIVSCISHLLRIGAIPVFVDSLADTWNMDVSQIEGRITSRTKAILVPHIYGLTVDMDPLVAIAIKHDLRIIEDAAESHGLQYKDRECGSFGDISTFSFYANKNITTGEGGMVLTNNKSHASRLRDLRNLNFRKNDRFVSDELGYNYRMSSMQAALGASQFARIDLIIAKRKEIAKFYASEFSNLENIQLPMSQTEYSENLFWVFGILLKNKLSGKSKEFQKKFDEAGIGTRPFFQALHRQPVLSKYGLSTQENLPVAENLSNSGFYIPNGLGMSDIEIEKVAKVTKEIFSNV